MGVVGPEAFLRALKRSNLLSAEQWSALDRELASRPAPSIQGGSAYVAELGRQLVERGWLTAWQSAKLQEGREAFFLGRYKLLDEIGIGGMGAVFKALHLGLGRVVAIKLMASSLIVSPTAVARFRREIETAAVLDHPNIVLAFDADCVGDVHFLVMEYVHGVDLATLLAEHDRLPLGWTCECIRQAAVGLQHAFERGMVHRDLKPSNLLVVAHPEPPGFLVKILDFGLAKFFSERIEDSGLTESGEILGTPDYVSPEQASDTKRADIRSDIFSLGVTMFRLLTGQFPFVGNNVMEKLMARVQQRAMSVRNIRSDVPAELDAILARVLSRDPAKRFATPGELARAITPYCDASDGRIDLTPRMAKSAASTSGLEVGDQTVDYVRPVPPRTTTDDKMEAFLSRLSREASSDQLHIAGLNERSALEPTRVALPPGDRLAPITGSAVAPQRSTSDNAGPSTPKPSEKSSPILAVEQPPPQGGTMAKPSHHTATIRRWGIAGGLVMGGLVTLAALLAWGAWSWLNPRLAVVEIDWPLGERVRERLTLDGAPVALPAQNPFRLSLAAGTHALVADREGYETLRHEQEFRPGETSVWKLDWRPTNETRQRQTLVDLRDRARKLAQAEPGQAPQDALRSEILRLWSEQVGTAASVETAKLLADLKSPFDTLDRRRLSPEDLQAAGYGQPGNAPRELLAIYGDGRMKHWHQVRSLSISHDGKTVASASLDGTVCLLDLESGRTRHTLFVSGTVRSVAFSPDDTILAIAAARTGLSLWNCQTGQNLRTIPNAQGPLAFSAQGDRLFAGLRAGGVGEWRVQTGEMQRTLLRSPAAPTQLAVARGDRFLVVTTRRATSETRATAEPAAPPIADGAATALGGHVDLIVLRDEPEVVAVGTGRQPLFSPSGEHLVMGTTDSHVALFPLSDKAPYLDPSTPIVLEDAGSPMSFDDGGQRLYTRRNDRVIVWDAARHSEMRTIRNVSGLAEISRNGRFVADADEAFGWLQFQNTVTGDDRPTKGHGLPIAAMAFVPDSSALITGGRDHTLKAWDAMQGTERLLVGSGVGPLAIHPDGRTIALATSDGHIKFWDVLAGKSTRALLLQARRITQLEMSSDGKWLAALGDWGSYRLTPRVWSFQNGREQTDQPESFTAARTVRITPDSRSLVSLDDNGGLQVWTLPDLRGKVSRDDLPLKIATSLLSFDSARITVVSRQAAPVTYRLDVDDAPPEVPTQAGLHSGMRSLVASPDGRWLAAGFADGTLHVLDALTGNRQHVLKSPGGPATSLAVRNDSAQLACTTRSGQVHLWNLPLTLGEELPSRTLVVGPPHGLVHRAHYSSDGRHLLTENGNHTAYLLRLADYTGPAGE